MEVKVGTCGWSVRGGRSAYYKVFSCIELQETFYRLPRAETAEGWVKDAPEKFEFSVKAWQAITHPTTSPTWRRVGGPPKWGRPEKFGLLKPTEENFKAWEGLIRICVLLRTKFIVIQTPPSFIPSPDALEDMRRFLSCADRCGMRLGWEPRGEWNQRPDLVRAICKELSLVHVVDPFRRLPFVDNDVAYFRLHGIGCGETSYSYTYTDEDLRKLLDMIKGIKGADTVYVMFNNVQMADDARRFLELVKSSGS